MTTPRCNRCNTPHLPTNIGWFDLCDGCGHIFTTSDGYTIRDLTPAEKVKLRGYKEAALFRKYQEELVSKWWG